MRLPVLAIRRCENDAGITDCYPFITVKLNVVEMLLRNRFYRPPSLSAVIAIEHRAVVADDHPISIGTERKGSQALPTMLCLSPTLTGIG